MGLVLLGASSSSSLFVTPSPIRLVVVAAQLVVLTGLSVSTAIVRRPVFSVSAFVLTFLLAAICSIHYQKEQPIRQILRLVALTTPIALYHLARGNTDLAISSGAGVGACICAATVMSLTTTIGELVALISAIVSVCAGRRSGNACGLCCGLVLALLPRLAADYAHVRSGCFGRGAPAHPWNIFIPFTIRAVRSALETGDAMTARGLLD